MQLTELRAAERMYSMLLPSFVEMAVGRMMVGLAYQQSIVSIMVKEKLRAVSSKVVIGKPSLTRCNSDAENQKTCQKTIILVYT